MKKRRQEKRLKPARVSRPGHVDAPAIDDPLAPLIALGVMVAALAVYLRTAARDIVVGDSAEFVTVALTGGVAHPPGYPLLVLLARAFSWIPFGTLAFRVNLVSVLSGVVTVGLVVLIARRLGASRIGAGAAGLMLAFVPLVWEWSIAIEAFALNAALAAGIVYLLVRWHQTPERMSFLVLAALLGGLASSNHQTIIFLVPSILMVLWWHRDSLIAQPRVMLYCVAAIAVGLLPYLYILWAAAKDPVLNWGSIRTFGELVDHFLRADYGTTKLASHTEGGSPIQRLLVIVLSLTAVEAVLLPIGVLAAYRRARWFLWFALLGFGFSGPAFIAIANVPADNEGRWMLEHFLVLPHVVVAPLAALGFTLATEWMQQRIHVTRRVIVESLLAAMTVALIAVSVARNYRHIDQRDNHLARRFAEDILATVPPRTILMAQADQVVLPITYLQAVEKKRPDVTLVMLGLFRGGEDYINQLRRRHADLVIPFNMYYRHSPAADTKAFIDANPGRQFALVGPPLDSSLFKTYWTYQRGLVNMVYPMARDVTLDEAEADFRRLLSIYRLPDPGRVKIATYERHILTAYGLPFRRLAQQYRLLGRPGDADSLLRRAVQIDGVVTMPVRK